MKKNILGALALMMLAATLQSAAPKGDKNVMTKEDGMYVVNTTTLGKGITGYVADTPVKVYIKKNTVVKVELLKNQETPKYNARIKKNLLTKWDNQKVKNAASQKVDGITGATFTSEAVIKNVQLALDYYLKNK
jgi:electron transport complex protein RnfG